jgi:hypothetical protein
MFQYLTLYNNSFQKIYMSLRSILQVTATDIPTTNMSCLNAFHHSALVPPTLLPYCRCEHTTTHGSEHRSSVNVDLCHRLYITSTLQRWIPLPRNIAVLLRASYERLLSMVWTTDYLNHANKLRSFPQNLEYPASIFWRESAVHDPVLFWAGF